MREMDWARVARQLKDDAEGIRRRAAAAFPNDIDTQKEMRTRAALLDSMAEALWAGWG